MDVRVTEDVANTPYGPARIQDPKIRRQNRKTDCPTFFGC